MLFLTAYFLFILLLMVMAIVYKLLRDQIIKLKEQLKAKDVLVGTASHEIKNPLTTISAYAQLVAKSNDLAGKAILREAERINQLVEGLFDYTKIAQGQYQVTRVEFDLKRVLERRVKAFEVVYPNRKIKLVCKVKNALIKTDQGAVERIMTNLLTNAVRYTEGEIIVELIRATSYYQIIVKDHGQGIPEEMEKVIWEAFSKSSTQGLGLGLFIVKQLVDSLKGEIRLETSGQGTSFIVLLPTRK